MVSAETWQFVTALTRCSVNREKNGKSEVIHLSVAAINPINPDLTSPKWMKMNWQGYARTNLAVIEIFYHSVHPITVAYDTRPATELRPSEDAVPVDLAGFDEANIQDRFDMRFYESNRRHLIIIKWPKAT